MITIEIINAQPGDSGKYKCVASNTLGSDSSDCVVIVEGQNYRDGPKSGNYLVVFFFVSSLLLIIEKNTYLLLF